MSPAPTKERLLRKHPIARATANGGGHSGTRTGGQLRESGGRCSRARNPRYGEIGLLYGPPERELACLLSRSRSVVIEGHACPARQRAGMRRVRLMSSKPKAKDPYNDDHRHRIKCAQAFLSYGILPSSPMSRATQTCRGLLMWLRGVVCYYASHRLSDRLT